MKVLRIFLLLLFISPLCLRASKIDSLKAILPHAADTEKINICVHIAYQTKDYSEAKFYFAKAAHLADSLHLPKKMYTILRDQGDVEDKFGEFEKAQQYYFFALD